ncbi:TPA: hypothetical protein DCX15_04050 [bacterium]|nr:hypothetical protein [bacterium]
MGRKILVVDDEPYVVRALSFILKKGGHEVTTAADGQEALRHVEEDKPDLILLDIMMPDLDGFEVTQRLKKDPATKDIYIILITAKGQEEDRKRGFESGADDYITKPFSPTGLIKMIDGIFKERSLKG